MSSLSPYVIGCQPSPSIPAETLMADAVSTFLLFFAVSENVGPSGYLDDKGVAVLECEDCLATKFGYPNDEGRPEHPLFGLGLADPNSSILEVKDSAWANEVSTQVRLSSQRIWGHRVQTVDEKDDNGCRHFILLLKEKTFECIAGRLTVRHYARDFPEAYTYVQNIFAGH
jgi:hypothetical protein